MNRLIRHTIEDVLGSVGLQRRRRSTRVILPALGILAAGAAIGAGFGLAFAPLSGRGFRAELGGHLARMSKRVQKLPERAQRAFNGAS